MILVCFWLLVGELEQRVQMATAKHEGYNSAYSSLGKTRVGSLIQYINNGNNGQDRQDRQDEQGTQKHCRVCLNRLHDGDENNHQSKHCTE